MRVLIKGAGDVASGVAYRLHQAGFSLLLTDIAKPTAVRRTVAFSQAIYDGQVTVEGVTAQLVENLTTALDCMKKGIIPVMIDEEAAVKRDFAPQIVVDAIMAKHNLNTSITDASIVIGLGPGFTAGVDCHAVIETKRGHFLGKVLYQGQAFPDTGVPGEIAGHSGDRIVRTPQAGIFYTKAQIGDMVCKGDMVACVDQTPVLAPIDGCLRGLLPNGIIVTAGMKAGDVDPRGIVSHCFSISDKARSIGGGVLEAIMHLGNEGKYEEANF